MAVAEIKAVQAKGVIAMAKHFAANEQETNRMTALGLETIVDRRVLHELYLLPFEMSVKEGDVASIMCAYNFVNGFQACENRELLTDVLRNQWGFDGYVQSDFFAVRSTAPSMRAGLDHLMPFTAMIIPPLRQSGLPMRSTQRWQRASCRSPTSTGRCYGATRRCSGWGSSNGSLWCRRPSTMRRAV